MSDTNATPKNTPLNETEATEVVVDSTPEVSPSEVVVEDAPVVIVDDSNAAVADAAVADAVVADAVVVENVPAEASVEPIVGTTGEVTPVVVTDEVAPVAAPVQTVYVTAPTPPKPKGNRGFGVLMALLATIAFAVVYAGVAAILLMIITPEAGVGAITLFFTNSLFFVPVLVFLVSMILWALLANRTGWWSWVIGSLAIGVFTFAVSIGALMLVTGEFSKSPSEAGAVFMLYLTSPIFIAAALVARETAIWFGAAIAKRGRRVRERNYETFQAFEMEQAQKRAEFGGPAAV